MTRIQIPREVSSHRKTLRFAQVGAFKHGSARDVARSVSAFGSIAAHDTGFLKNREIVNDVINLLHGRDFLIEERIYDVVVVHSILSPKIKMFRQFPRLRVSPLHSLQNWRKRLHSTKAQFIAICETDPATLSGGELGEISGYDIIENGGFVTLYRKKAERQK